MLADILLEPTSLRETHLPGQSESLANDAHALLLQQKLSWDILRNNYLALQEIQTRTLDFEGFKIKLQYNPKRLTSSAAKVDEKSIRQRRCFLCPRNLPGQQRALLFSDDYLILANPFPIFPEHFTIPTHEHLPQRIAGAVRPMLSLAQALAPRYTVFYNGPRCGASAPDHLHFQAGSLNLMPLDSEYESIKRQCAHALAESAALGAYAVEGCLRNFIALESSDPTSLVRAFDLVYRALQDLTPAADEPMINVLASYHSDHWRVILFPRAKHRPDFFFADGHAKILLSPAAVDLGGLCVTPIEKDFLRLTHDHLRQMFAEVCCASDVFDELKTRLKQSLASV